MDKRKPLGAGAAIGAWDAAALTLLMITCGRGFHSSTSHPEPFLSTEFSETTQIIIHEVLPVSWEVDESRVS